MSDREYGIDSEIKTTKASILDIKSLQDNNQDELEKMKIDLNSIKNQIRLVKLRQNEPDSKLGFSLRGGKEATGSSVGVFVSHVEKCSEADRKGLKIGDQLLQVNGLNVNLATYEEVIGLIKQTQKCHDILLKVNNFGKIPFQEKSGDCIKWLQVIDLIDSSRAETETANEAFSKTTPECNSINKNDDSNKTTPINGQEFNSSYSSSNNTTAYMCKQATSSLSSDEGIESCESRRAISLSSESENELHHPNQVATSDRYQEDSAISSTLTLSNDETCSCSSACSISISSVQTTSTTNTTTSVELENEALGQRRHLSSSPPEDIEIIIRVPGGRQTNESFGCGVVKGPDEWPGIFVQNVKPGSLAQRVGLQPGDQLTHADGQVLVELTFDAAIALIKQLQQQQDELLLHVRKGAALKHLSENRQRSRDNQQSSQLTTGTETRPNEGAIKQQQAPKSICAKIDTTSNNLKPALASADVDETSWSFDATSSSPFSSSNLMQTPSSGSKASKVFTTGNKEISGTQNQLSGKHWQGTLQQQVAACGSQDKDKEKKFDRSQGRRRKRGTSSNGGREEGEGEEETNLDEEDTKQITIRVGNNKLNSQANANQTSCESGFNVLGKPSIELRSINNQKLTNGKFLVEEKQAKNPENEMKTIYQQQQQPVASSCKSRNYDLNGNHLDSNNEDKSVKQGHSFDEDHSKKLNYRHQIKSIPSNNKTRQDCEDNYFKDNQVDVDCGEDEEIRIVSQNCKLHHQPFHNSHSKSNLVQEKFPQHPETHKLQQAKSRNILVRKIQLNEASNKRQTVDDMRRKLDCAKGSSRRPLMHRYVSFENLNSSRLACPIQKQQQSQQLQQLSRGSSAIRRSKTEENRYINDDYIVYSQPQVEQHRSLSKQRLYSRSSSVLSHNANFQGTCCTQVRPSLVDLASRMGGKAVKCVQKQQKRQIGVFPMVRQHSQCCLQQAQQQNPYGGALDPLFALSRSKARSMDKLNMSINLNYVNISQDPYKVSRQALLGEACGADSITSSGSGGNSKNNSKQQRRIILRNQLAGHQTTLGSLENDPLICCKPNTLRPFTHQPNSTPLSYYNYSTASRLISNVSRGSPAAVASNRMRLLQATCCSGLFSESCSANLCQSSICSSHPNQIIENRPRVCCSPSLDRPIYAKCNIGKSKLQEQLNNNSYSCCSTSSTLTCCQTSLHNATTDSRAYLSGSNERYHTQRLLKMCPALASPPPPQPPPPPPPPKLMTTSSKQHYNCLAVSQQRDTSQQLTTFISTGCPSISHLSNNNNSSNRMLPNSSDVSPTCSSSYSSASASASTSTTPTQSDHSSLSMDRLRSVSPLNNQQQSSIGDNKQTGNQNKASHKSVPCPPPMPAPDVEFERKLSSILRQQDLLETENTCNGDNGNNNNGKNNNGKNKSDNLLQGGGRKQETNKNRLCFVDELKLIAKRQQQQSASQVSTCSSSLSSIPVSLCSGGETSAIGSSSSSSSSDQSPIDSSTLIKIINASKSPANAGRNKGSYGCQVTNRFRQQQHLEQNNNNKCGHKCSASSSNEQDNDHQMRCNIKSSHHCKQHEISPKSVVKLDDEHNKRRQHEMLMKEFKSAHSRMFKRRNANVEEESNKQIHSTTSDCNKPLENNSKQQQKASIRAMGSGKTTVGLQTQQPVHLAAAN